MTDFERAVEAIIAGDESTLASLLRANPELARARSEREHRSTLLHYISANGVEDERQISPPNAVAIAKLLLDAGAEVDAVSEAYGGDSTTMGLLVSSVHPARANVQVPLVDTLVDYGAAVDGPANDCAPLVTALSFHYLPAAEALVRRGARVDTIATAAGLGREDLVRSFIGQDRRLRSEVPRIKMRWMKMPDLPLALLWAASFGHAGVVEFLSRQHVDLAAQDDQGFTALHWAAFNGHLDVVEILLSRNAPLNIRNNYGGTVLGGTRWAVANLDTPVDRAPVIARLIAAGAKE